MPKIKSAKKELRKGLRRREKNIGQKDALKQLIKNFKKLVLAKKLNEAKTSLSEVYKKLDKAAKVNLIKKNKASRTKSRLSQLLSRAAR